MIGVFLREEYQRREEDYHAALADLRGAEGEHMAWKWYLESRVEYCHQRWMNFNEDADPWYQYLAKWMRKQLEPS